MKLPKVLNNSIVTYIVYILAVLNVFNYTGNRSWMCLAIFTFTSFGCACYCKNTTCGLIVGLLVSNMIFGCNKKRNQLILEGMEDWLNLCNTCNPTKACIPSPFRTCA